METEFKRGDKVQVQLATYWFPGQITKVTEDEYPLYVIFETIGFGETLLRWWYIPVEVPEMVCIQKFDRDNLTRREMIQHRKWHLDCAKTWAAEGVETQETIDLVKAAERLLKEAEDVERLQG